MSITIQALTVSSRAQGHRRGRKRVRVGCGEGRLVLKSRPVRRPEESMRRKRTVGIVPLFILLLFALGLMVPASLAQMGAREPAPPPERTVAVFGQAIHYWDVGAGPVVVLLHGSEAGRNLGCPRSQSCRGNTACWRWTRSVSASPPAQQDGPGAPCKVFVALLY